MSTDATSGAAKGRLGPGELRRQVAQLLAGDPSRHWRTADAAQALGDRSSGAVGNALEALVASGHAHRVRDKPRTYAAGTATAEAAKPKTAARPSTTTAPSPRKPAATNASAPIRGPVRRPNGQSYHPRVLADLPDVTVLRRLRAANVPVLLYGPPGTGKTSLAEAAFPDLITIAGDGDTAVADFVGEYTQGDDGRYQFVYGPLVEAMQQGRPLFIDDCTLVSPTVLAAIYPSMDGRGQITVKAHKGETITAKEGFYVLGGHNPGVHGAVLSDALASRFSARVFVETDYDLARALKIDPRAIRVARNLATRVKKGEITWAPQLRELIAYQKIADAIGTDAAVANLVGIAPEEDSDVVATVVRSFYGQPVTRLSLGRQI
jgi:nitric oxide reductase NorQ protein